MTIASRRPLIVGNWKMNGRRDDAIALANACAEQLDDVNHCDVAICPSHVHLQAVGEKIKSTNIALGAQDVSPFVDDGAHTGDVSASMLADIGCKYVIIGHSERRQYHHETDQTVEQKLVSLLTSDDTLTPIVCVGENLEAREQDLSWSVVRGQLEALEPGLNEHDIHRVVVAYEPIWAIGTGKAASAGDVQAMMSQIRAFFATFSAKLPGSSEADGRNIRLLYGGSLKPANAAELLSLPDVDGGLIGGAALDAEAFAAIAAASQQ